FLSCRRRYTRSKRDWSSDVCSSDLTSRVGTGGPCRTARSLGLSSGTVRTGGTLRIKGGALWPTGFIVRPVVMGVSSGGAERSWQIGRAACRERGEVWAVTRLIKDED